MSRLANSFILVAVIVFCSYGMATVSVVTIENFLCNAILASFIFFFAFFKVILNPNLNKRILFLLFVSLIPLVITFRFNLISLCLILSLILFKDDVFNQNGRKFFLFFSISLFFLIFSLNYFWGYNDFFSKYIWNPREEQYVFRSALGFTHPNQAMLKCLGIILVFLTGVTKKNLILYSLISVIIVLFLYSFTSSRTVVLTISFSVLMLVFLCNKLEKLVSYRMKRIVALYPLVFLILSLVAMMFSDNEFLNLLFSGRLEFYKRAVEVFGFTLFGSPTIEKSSDFVIDSSYFNTLISKGIIFFFCYIVIIRYSIMNAIITYKKVILLTTFFLSAFTETMFFKFDLVYALLLIIFFDKKDTLTYEENSNLS